MKSPFISAAIESQDELRPEAAAGVPAQPAPGAARDCSPTGNTGGKSSERGFAPDITANPQAAIVDYLNVTFPVSHWDQPDVAVFRDMYKGVNAPFGVLLPRVGGRLHYAWRQLFCPAGVNYPGRCVGELNRFISCWV